MITVITPTHKRPDLLLRCIRSIQAQSYQDYEHLIFSDHCSKARQVYELVKKDKRISFYENLEPHIWNAGAIGKHFGVQAAKFNFICYCDDDNILLPNHLEVMISNFQQGSEVVFTKNFIADFEGDVNLEEKHANGVIERILKFPVEDIESNSKIIKPAHLEYTNYIHIPFDTISLGHTKKAYEETVKWKPAKQLLTNNEDGAFISNLKSVTKETEVTYDRQYTSLYFSRHGSGLGKDYRYEKELESLKENDIFVYPELLKKLKIL